MSKVEALLIRWLPSEKLEVINANAVTSSSRVADKTILIRSNKAYVIATGTKAELMVELEEMKKFEAEDKADGNAIINSEVPSTSNRGAIRKVRGRPRGSTNKRGSAIRARSVGVDEVQKKIASSNSLFELQTYDTVIEDSTMSNPETTAQRPLQPPQPTNFQTHNFPRFNQFYNAPNQNAVSLTTPLNISQSFSHVSRTSTPMLSPYLPTATWNDQPIQPNPIQSSQSYPNQHTFLDAFSAPPSTQFSNFDIPVPVSSFPSTTAVKSSASCNTHNSQQTFRSNFYPLNEFSTFSSTMNDLNAYTPHCSSSTVYPSTQQTNFSDNLTQSAHQLSTEKSNSGLFSIAELLTAKPTVSTITPAATITTTTTSTTTTTTITTTTTTTTPTTTTTTSTVNNEVISSLVHDVPVTADDTLSSLGVAASMSSILNNSSQEFDFDDEERSNVPRQLIKLPPLSRATFELIDLIRDSAKAQIDAQERDLHESSSHVATQSTSGENGSATIKTKTNSRIPENNTFEVEPYLQPGEDKIQLGENSGFYVPIAMNVFVRLQAPPEKDWKNYVYHMLNEIYKKNLVFYTAKGGRNTLPIHPYLIVGMTGILEFCSSEYDI